MNNLRQFNKYRADDLFLIFGGLGWLFSVICLISMAVSVKISRTFSILLLCFLCGVWSISILCLYYGIRCGIYIENGEIYEMRWKKHPINPNEIKCIVIIPKTMPFRSVYIGGGPRVEEINEEGKRTVLYDIILLNDNEFQLISDYKHGGDESFIINNRNKIIAYSIFNCDLMNYLKTLNDGIKVVNFS